MRHAGDLAFALRDAVEDLPYTIVGAKRGNTDFHRFTVLSDCGAHIRVTVEVLDIEKRGDLWDVAVYDPKRAGE